MFVEILPPSFLGTFSTAISLLKLILGMYMQLNSSDWYGFLDKEALNAVSDRRTDGIYCSKLS